MITPRNTGLKGIMFLGIANDVTVYEYTFENSYNRSRKLKIKSHNLVTSQNSWFDYECAVNK